MPKKYLKKLIIILLTAQLCGLTLFFLITPEAKASGVSGSWTEDNVPYWENPFDNLQITIPFMERFSEASACPDDPSKTCVYWIGEYIAGIYKYAIGIVGILAAVVLMVGGIIWLTAGGNQTRIGEAKSWIGASLTGLVIALSSYLILYQVNPELTKINPIRITEVQEIPSTTASTTPTGFADQASPQLASFISCMNGKNIPNFNITSITDTHIAQGTCDPTNPNESFENPTRCQHTQYSCHYGGTSCADKGSYAIDIDDSADGKKVAAAATQCGVNVDPYSDYPDYTARCLLDEDGTHHHVSIGAGAGCGCDTNPSRVGYCVNQQ